MGFFDRFKPQPSAEDMLRAKQAAENDFKRKISADLIQNIEAIVAYKGGEHRVGAQDIEQEAIYYACDILLHQKAEAGYMPADQIVTDIIKCITDIMQQIFPRDYTARHAAFAQEAVRTNLTQAPNMQQIVDRYYDKIYQR
jgi:hypothetical protein